MNKERGLVMMVQEGDLRKITSLAEQNRGPKVWFAIQGNVLRDSIDKDIHHESTGQRKVMKYLRKKCYPRIECSVVNYLTALMRK